MTEFKYIGAYGMVYPNHIIPGHGSLAVEPGDICELDEAPDDGLWIPVEPEKKVTLSVKPGKADVNA